MKNSQRVRDTLPIFTFRELSNQQFKNLFQTGMPSFNTVEIAFLPGPIRVAYNPAKKKLKEETSRSQSIDTYLSIFLIYMSCETI